MPPYFIVKLSKNELKDRREKIGSLYMPPNYVFMTRECQASEIVAIGDEAHEYFPEAKIGDILIYHHFISGKTTDKKQVFHLIDEDDDFNYYTVNAFSLPGEKNLTYGIWNGDEILPNFDYIFLEPTQEEKTNEMVLSAYGLYLPKPIKKTREELREKMKKNMQTIQQLSPLINYSKEAKERVKSLEAENDEIVKEANKRKYEPFQVAAIHPLFNKYVLSSFGFSADKGADVAMLNIATHTKIEFNKKEYIIAETQYCAGPLKWYQKSVSNFKKAAMLV